MYMVYIGSMDSAQMSDVSTSNWTFTVMYTNAAQDKRSLMIYTLARSLGTQFSFTKEDPPNTYVSWCPIR